MLHNVENEAGTVKAAGCAPEPFAARFGSGRKAPGWKQVLGPARRRFLPQQKVTGMRYYSADELEWVGDVLHLGKGRALVTIEPDVQWPKMWRVRLPDGSLTDMVNRVRAKDAACSIALSMFNQRRAAAA
jgi:hypothetical protein